VQMKKGERSILAYFPSSTRAQQAATELRQAGLVEEPGSLQVDRISRFGVKNDTEYDNPINAATTLSGVTLFAGDSDQVEGTDPLLAADPSASGVGDRGYGVAGGQAFLLTLVTGEQNVERAIKIIKANGGRV